MKKILLLILLSASFNSFSQTSNHKNNFAIGGGQFSYNGDLGNAWFDIEEELYGFVGLYFNRYISKSFDIGFALTYGDYGHCVEDDDGPFWADGSEVLNMRSRMTSGILSFKYKFANGYLLNEESRFSPFLFAGIGINNLKDVWTHKRVHAGNYGSINGGLGLRYNFNQAFNLNYSFGIGYFTSDDIDYKVVGKNDMYMQNTFSFGINF